MTTQVLDLASVFGRDPASARVIVTDGYGIRLAVERGHLVVNDGLGRHRRTRRFSRAERTVRRIVILGHTGSITLEALAWCQHVGIHLVQIDGTQVLSVTGVEGTNDARLRRQQALAANNATGLAVTRALLAAKLVGQATVLRQLEVPAAAEFVDALAGDLASAGTTSACRDVEATAANVYFGAWAGRVTARFAARDADRIPVHWHGFDARRSAIVSGRSARKAATPVNALLNYCYALAEAECRIAALAVGLDPGLGIVHVDKRGRDSLALDLLEAIRPLVDQHVLELLAARHLRAVDFHETPVGNCRLLPPLTHACAQTLPAWARAVAPVAEAVAHQLAHASTAPIPLRTPLTQANVRRTQSAKRVRPERVSATPAAPLVAATCRVCGAVLPERRRQLCSGCWTVERHRLATERAEAGAAELARRRREGNDPSNSPDAARKRHASLVANHEARHEWSGDAVDPDRLGALRWGLKAVPLGRIAAATGLSISACSRIRSGQLRPHPRHMRALTELITSPDAPTEGALD